MHGNGVRLLGTLMKKIQKYTFFLMAVFLPTSALSLPVVPLNENQSLECYAHSIDFQVGERAQVTPSEELLEFRAIPNDDPLKLSFEQLVEEKIFWWTTVMMREPQKTRFMARNIYEQVVELDAANAATEIQYNPNASTPPNYLVHQDILISLAYAVLTAKESNALTQEEIEYLIDFLQTRTSIQGFMNGDGKFANSSVDNIYTAETCNMENIRNLDRFLSGLGECQNITLGRQHLRSVIGFITGDVEEQQRGRLIYEFAINDLMDDGALYREAVRGAWSWSYYSHALNHLMAIGSLLERNGGTIFEYESPANQTIHDAVRFYIDSLNDPTNPSLMHKYAVANYGIGDGRELANEPLSLVRVERVLDRFMYYAEWAALYRSHFPNHENTQLINNLDIGSRMPQLSHHTGFNPWCTMSGGLD